MAPSFVSNPASLPRPSDLQSSGFFPLVFLYLFQTFQQVDHMPLLTLRCVWVPLKWDSRAGLWATRVVFHHHPHVEHAGSSLCAVLSPITPRQAASAHWAWAALVIKRCGRKTSDKSVEQVHHPTAEFTTLELQVTLAWIWIRSVKADRDHRNGRASWTWVPVSWGSWPGSASGTTWFHTERFTSSRILLDHVHRVRIRPFGKPLSSSMFQVLECTLEMWFEFLSPHVF